jgi:hypothetical protein
MTLLRAIMSLSRAIMYSTEREMTFTGAPTSFVGSGKCFPLSFRLGWARVTGPLKGERIPLRQRERSRFSYSPLGFSC